MEETESLESRAPDSSHHTMKSNFKELVVIVERVRAYRPLKTEQILGTNVGVNAAGTIAEGSRTERANEGSHRDVGQMGSEDGLPLRIVKRAGS